MVMPSTKIITQKNIFTLCFILYSSWLLSFPFEGQILYSYLLSAGIEPENYIFGAIIAHIVGLVSCGFVVKKQSTAKYAILISVLVCIIGSMFFYTTFYFMWFSIIIILGYFAGIFISSIAYYFNGYLQENQGHKVIADVLIYSNILMIVINIISVNISNDIALSISIFMLFAAMYYSMKLDWNLDDNSSIGKQNIYWGHKQNVLSIVKPFIVLSLFIAIISINSGLMYQVVSPAFSHFEVFNSYYWAVPYIAALFILRNMPKGINKAYILYIALTMIGISYLAFMFLDTSMISSYIIIDTLMLGAFGVCDLFWWSIIISFMDYVKNPAKILGIGLSMNLLGVLLGKVISKGIIVEGKDFQHTSILALLITFIVLIILPVLNYQLMKLFDNHRFLVYFTSIDHNHQEEKRLKYEYAKLLTEKEIEVVHLLLKGYTYRAIGEELYITQNTIKYHVKNIYQKLHITSKMELIKLFSEINYF